MKSDLLVTFVETDTHSNQEEDLLESLAKHNVPYVAFGKGREWKAFSDKFFYFREGIKKLNPTQKYVIFVDSRDVIFYRGVDEILEKIETHYPNLQVLFNGETNCYPDKSIADKYPNQNKKYKYFKEYLVPDGADTSSFSAKLNNGILSVEVPKLAEKKPLTIPIN